MTKPVCAHEKCEAQFEFAPPASDASAAAATAAD
jgi:hypothetical protein